MQRAKRNLRNRALALVAAAALGVVPATVTASPAQAYPICGKPLILAGQDHSSSIMCRDSSDAGALEFRYRVNCYNPSAPNYWTTWSAWTRGGLYANRKCPAPWRIRKFDDDHQVEIRYR